MVRSRVRALCAGVLFAALAAPLVASAAGATSSVSSSRISGSDRYATAAQIARTKFPDGATTAVLASGLNYPDALAGAYLAGLDAAPILLTDPNTLSPETRQAFSTLHTKNVIILGGVSAVSAAVASAIDALTSTASGGEAISVARLGGTTRYDTMQAIDTTDPASSVGTFRSTPTAIVATGLNFADAVAAAGLSYKEHFPVVLTDPNTLSSEATTVLTTDHIGQVLIMGGTSAVSTADESAIDAMGISTLDRFSGQDRTDTAQQLATYEVTNFGFTNSDVVLTRGDDYPDALAGGVYAGDPKPTLLSEDPNALGTYTTDYLTTNAPAISQLTALGGTEAISVATLNAGIVAAGGTAPPPSTSAPTYVSAADVVAPQADGAGGTITVTFNQAVTVDQAYQLYIFSNSTCTTEVGAALDSSTQPGADQITVPVTNLSSAPTWFTISSGLVTGNANNLPNTALGCTQLGGSTSGAPAYVSAADVVAPQADGAGGTITVTFNQAVTVDQAYQLYIFSNPSCTTEVGAALDSSTQPAADQITVPVTNLSSAPTWFTISSGLVTGTANNLPNTALGCTQLGGSTSGTGPKYLAGTSSIQVGDAYLTFNESLTAGQADDIRFFENSECSGAAAAVGTGTEIITGNEVTIEEQGNGMAGPTAANAWITISPGFVSAGGLPNISQPCTELNSGQV
jgi:putative cell wall-binding protein